MTTKKEIGFSLSRQAIVEAAFLKFDPTATGFVPLQTLTDTYNATSHPHVSLGDLAPSVAKKAMVAALTPSANQHNGSVAVEDFYLFHERMSAEVDAMKVRAADSFYHKLVDGLWGVSTVRLLPTGIVPLTVYFPEGILATQKMDLLWRDEKSGALVGYKNVVRPQFARAWLPEAIRGSFAFPEETKGTAVTYLQSQPALQPPYSIVWDGASGKEGLQDIVVSNVDLDVLPEYLRAIILSAKEAAAVKSQVEFLRPPTVSNPMYRTSNSHFGKGADEATIKVQQEKTQALTGQNPVGVFAGRIGKFSGTFAGGMPSASGLNFSGKQLL